MTHLTRRNFLKTAAGLAAAGGLLPAGSSAWAQNAPEARPFVRLGGPIYKKTDDPEELALAHRALGYRAAYCPMLKLEDGERIRAVERAFAKHDVVIAEVGRWKNLLDADEAARRKNLQEVIEGLALADAVGARCCVDIAGSFNKTVWYGPDPRNLSQEFFDLAVENARKIIDAVKPKRAKFSYEMMGWNLPDSADSYLKLHKAIGREAFGVHFDPCNAVNSPERFYNNAALLNECFDKLGQHIVSCHAKDLEWVVEMNVHFKEVPPGRGALDYATYLKRLVQLPQQPPLMMEHLAKAEEYDQARQHIMTVGEKCGIGFGA